MRVRRQLFVDPAVQGKLMFRVAAYWLLSLTITGLLLLDWRMVIDPGKPFYSHFREMWYWYSPVAGIATLILLPITLLDCVRLSNQFVGPVFRLRRELRKLGTWEDVQSIRFREGDFWREFADEFNAVAERLQTLTTQLAEAQTKAASAAIDSHAAADAGYWPEQRGGKGRADSTFAPDEADETDDKTFVRL
ncbi:MAG TPA: hypothetical protein VGI75_09455 [Pirellulales bacterium]|jgi:hypothetical protein